MKKKPLTRNLRRVVRRVVREELAHATLRAASMRAEFDAIAAGISSPSGHSGPADRSADGDLPGSEWHAKH